MGIRAWSGAFTLLLIITQSGSHWLNCGQIPECTCKWTSGKKTASCAQAGLTHLPSLETEIQVLNLHGNPLKTIGRGAFQAAGLLNLQRVNLSSTGLTFLHPEAFNLLSILIELDLSQNELVQISPDLFKSTERLRHLILNDNPLNTLPADLFPPLNFLKNIEISRCKLRSINQHAFRNLQSLEVVNIHQNELSFLHPDTFNLPKIKALTLSDNPWYCDCRLREFHQWFLRSNLGNEEVICTGPENEADMSWRVLKREDLFCPPSAYSSPTVIRTEAGADIIFGCLVRGDPKPTVNWLFQYTEQQNGTSDVVINEYPIENSDVYSDDLNRSAQWVNVTISNVTNDYAGEWKCSAKSRVGEASAYVTIFLPKARTARTATAVVPDYSTFILVAGSLLAMTCSGFVASFVCWKTRRRVPPSRSFTDQEKKLLDTSLAVSCDRTSGDRSSYGFEMLDRSMSLESEDIQRLEPVQITIEGPPGTFPPPPEEFALPAPYGSIFISVQVAPNEELYPDLLGGGATLPRRSRTCFLKSAYDNMGPRITAAGSSTWSLPGANVDKTVDKESMTMPLSTFSTEFTAL